ncbi:MAG: hypothetical protein RL220_1282 [Bacteroidota bacterium]
MNHFRITEEQIVCALPQSWTENGTDGGHVIFCGTIRTRNKGKDVIHIDFEAYEPMVIRELEKIASRIKAETGVNRLLLIHRTGRVLPGEVAVLAAASGTHRSEAFRACEMLMNELKRSVPIWKKERTSDGETWITPTP